MNSICITKSYFLGFGLSLAASNLRQKIIINDTLSKTNLTEKDLCIYHLININPVSFNDLHHIKQRSNLIILNDTYIQSSILSRYFNAITLNARMSLPSVQEMIYSNYSLSDKRNEKSEDFFSSLTNKEMFVLFKILGGSNIDEISRLMSLSKKRIYSYRRSVLKKTGLKTITHFMCSGIAGDIPHRNV
ncbi:TPA: hypothetical protein N5N83_004446 [Enterobacter bugandensis]|nr:hypothetical protein [Enterobacter bugandensis]